MTLPKISSIWRRTSTWLDRSSFGSRSWMTRFWIRNLTSRNDSRTGAWLVSRGAGGGVGGAPPGRDRQVGTGRARRGASGRRPDPVERSRSASAGTSPTPLLAPRGSTYGHGHRHANNDFFWAALPAVVAGRRDLRPLADDRLGQPEDVLGDLRLPVATGRTGRRG